MRSVVCVALMGGCMAPLDAEGYEFKAADNPVYEQLLGSPPAQRRGRRDGAQRFSAGDQFQVQFFFFRTNSGLFGSSMEAVNDSLSTIEAQAIDTTSSAHDADGQALATPCDLRYEGKLKLIGFDAGGRRVLFSYVADQASYRIFNLLRHRQCKDGTLLTFDWSTVYSAFLNGWVSQFEGNRTTNRFAYPTEPATVVVAQTDGFWGGTQSVLGLGAGRECRLKREDRLVLITSYEAQGDIVHLAHMDWGSARANRVRSRDWGECYAHNFYWVSGQVAESATESVIVNRLIGAHQAADATETQIGGSNQSVLATHATTGARSPCTMETGGALRLKYLSESGSRGVAVYRPVGQNDNECADGALIVSTRAPSLWDGAQ